MILISGHSVGKHSCGQQIRLPFTADTVCQSFVWLHWDQIWRHLVLIPCPSWSPLLLEAFDKFVLQLTSSTTPCLKTVTKEFKSLFLEPVLLECRLQNDKKVKWSKSERYTSQKYVLVQMFILFCAINRKPVYRKRNTPSFRKFFLLGRGSKECIFSLPAWGR